MKEGIELSTLFSSSLLQEFIEWFSGYHTRRDDYPANVLTIKFLITVPLWG